MKRTATYWIAGLGYAVRDPEQPKSEPSWYWFGSLEQVRAFAREMGWTLKRI